MIIKVMKKISTAIREMIAIIIISIPSFFALVALLLLIVLMYIQYLLEGIYTWIYKKFSIN